VGKIWGGGGPPAVAAATTAAAAASGCGACFWRHACCLSLEGPGYIEGMHLAI
jgi:hypothetical protein